MIRYGFESTNGSPTGMSILSAVNCCMGARTREHDLDNINRPRSPLSYSKEVVPLLIAEPRTYMESPEQYAN